MKSRLRELCTAFLQDELPENSFLQRCLQEASASLPETHVDLNRQARCGFPEVVYAEGKPLATLAAIVRSLVQRAQPVMATRVTAEQATHLSGEFPDGIYHARGRTFRLPNVDNATPAMGHVPVVTAGTTDQDVAWEAIETLNWMNVNSVPIFDLGVAGPHRLPAHATRLADADAVIVVAGMEGALPSVVGGYVNCPVIAVPTSVGYGANFQGLSALLSMLNSCAANVACVNIDAGFKAGYLAGLIAHRRHATDRAGRSPTNP